MFRYPDSHRDISLGVCYSCRRLLFSYGKYYACFLKLLRKRIDY